MKKFIVLLVIIAGFVCCTRNEFARNYGGSQTINLPAGQRLVEATWKDANLWYLTEPMDDDYVPKTKVFQESSSWQVMEGTVTFIESR